MFIYFYSIKTLVFQCKFVAYVGTSVFKRVAAERRVRTAGLVHIVTRTYLIHIIKIHFVRTVLLMCHMQEAKQTHIVKGLSFRKISTGI